MKYSAHGLIVYKLVKTAEAKQVASLRKLTRGACFGPTRSPYLSNHVSLCSSGIFGIIKLIVLACVYNYAIWICIIHECIASWTH